MKDFIDKLIARLEALKRIEQEREDNIDENGHYNDCEEAFDDGESQGRYSAFVRSIKIVNQLAEEYNNGWIPCSERLPEDCDNRFYMCIVENHEEDLPMFCQYEEDYGFGFWHDYYDEHTLGFVDSEFKTNEELGYEKVIAWQPLPTPFVQK